MDEHVRATLPLQEAVTLFLREPLDGAVGTSHRSTPGDVKVFDVGGAVAMWPYPVTDSPRIPRRAVGAKKVATRVDRESPSGYIRPRDTVEPVQPVDNRPRVTSRQPLEDLPRWRRR